MEPAARPVSGPFRPLGSPEATFAARARSCLGAGQTGRRRVAARRAEDAGLADAGSLPGLLAAVDLVLAVVPPEAAVAVAE
jgi:replication-associated recombination protein RarA